MRRVEQEGIQGIVQEVTILGREGLGSYIMLVKDDGTLICEHVTGVSHSSLPLTAKWKTHFYLEFKKIGILQYHFDMIDVLSGRRLKLRTWRTFGKLLAQLVQAEQRH
jgi:hypothetical protein